MTETHETHEAQARAKVRETVKKITEYEAQLARNAIAYRDALAAGDDSACLAQLEKQDVTRRTLRLYNDKLPILQAAVGEAERLDAAPEIAAQCIEAQRLCDDEAKKIADYYSACEVFKTASEALIHHSHKTNHVLITLKNEINRVGSTVRPAVTRAQFKKPEYVFEHGRQPFAHFTERSITEYKNYSEAE